MHWESPHRIEYETVIVYHGRHKYVITQSEDKTTVIQTLDVDAENRVIDNRGGPNPISFDFHPFDFTQTNQISLMNRLKTILVFQ